MPDIDGVYPPIGYPWWWLAIATGLLVLLAAWIWWIFFSTRKPKPPKAPARPPVEKLRAEALATLDAVAKRYFDGELTLRGLHVELSALVRGYAKGRAGIDATVLSLAEIREYPAAAPVADVIAKYYQPEFAARTDVEATDSIEEARGVLTRW